MLSTCNHMKSATKRSLGAAAIILAPVSLAATGYWVPALFIAGFVAMMIVPGHILNYKSNHPKQ